MLHPAALFALQGDDEKKKIEALEESLKKSGLDRSRAQQVRPPSRLAALRSVVALVRPSPGC